MVRDTTEEAFNANIHSLKIRARDFSENLQIGRLGRFQTHPTLGNEITILEIRLNAAIYVEAPRERKKKKSRKHINLEMR